MADGSIEIKIEPLDDEETPAIKVEELIIQPDFDNNIYTEAGKNHEAVTIKQEPVDEDEDTSTQLDVSTQKAAQEPEKPKFECDTCKRDFNSSRGLALHLRLRCRNVNSCEICGLRFLTRIILEDHLQQHQQKSIKTAKTSPASRRTTPKTSPKSSPEAAQFSCKICQLSFTTPQSLTSHNRIHEGFKHICNKCGKSFKSMSALKKHNSGDTCVTEAIEDVLKYSQGDIKIKEEVESEDESSTQGVQSTDNERTTSQEFHHTSPPTSDEAAAVEVKQEPVEEPVKIKEEPEDYFDYEELILQELIDRKAKSIAKVKATQVQTTIHRPVEKNLKSDALDKTDFEEIIQSNTVTVSPAKATKSERRISENKPEDKSNQHSMSPEHKDFEKIIKSNAFPPTQDRSEIIQSLKDEYQKAKKRKLDESLTDDSSHNSVKALDNLSSLYFHVTGDPEPYNRAVRRLKKTHSDYRYIWVCTSCPRRYVQRHGFLKHLLSTHFSEKADLDGMLFELKPEPTIASTNNVDSYCHICRVTLADAASLKKHRSEFHKEDTSVQLPFKCEKCGKFCSTRSTLGDHIQANCGTEPQYECTMCGKKFYTRSTLNLHKTMHTGELPHKCTFCEKQFRTRGQLTVHTRTHTGERPFPCKVCEKRFTHRETLIAHLSRHIDMKRYKCYGCHSFFSCISGLKTHRLTRMSTCGQVKLNARPVGPRVRVIKGNVIFEPQPKVNPYFRREQDDTDETTKRKILLQQNGQNKQDIETLFKKDRITVDS